MLCGFPASAASISAFVEGCAISRASSVLVGTDAARATPALAAESASAAVSERLSFESMMGLLVRAGKAPACRLVSRFLCGCFIAAGLEDPAGQAARGIRPGPLWHRRATRNVAPAPPSLEARGGQSAIAPGGLGSAQSSACYS